MRPDRFVTALALILSATAPLAGPRFEPVEAPAHIYAGGWEHFVGGGLAGFDCDGDDRPELYAAGGSNPAQLMRNRSAPGRVAFVADTPPALALTGVTGAYPLYLNADAHIDLAVLRVGANLLLRGGPNCTFAPFGDLGFTSAARWTTAFSATWEAGQSLPTLAFGNYVDRTNPAGPFRACDRNLLYRPDGPVYAPPVPLDPGFCPLSMLFSDWSGHGRADLRISNDRHYYVDDGQEQLWAMQPVPRLYTHAEGWRTHRLWGMGIAARDIDHDGRQEVFLTSMGDQRLQRRADPFRPVYEDVPFAMGTTAHRPYQGEDGRPSSGWHVAFGDVQNDGRDDIFIAKGNVDQMPDAAMDDPNSLLVQRPDGRFAEAGDRAGIGSPHRGRGAVLADFDGDGRLDLAVVNRRAAMEIWRNVTPDAGNWLTVDLHQPVANRGAIGGWIELREGHSHDGPDHDSPDHNGPDHAGHDHDHATHTAAIRRRERTVGGGHAGGFSGPEHFGLGAAEVVELRVRWPDGALSAWVATGVNRALRLGRRGNELRVLRPSD